MKALLTSTALGVAALLTVSFFLQWAAIHGIAEIAQWAFFYNMEPEYYHSLSATGILWLLKSVL